MAIDRDELWALRAELDAESDLEIIERAYDLLLEESELTAELVQWRWDEYFRVVDAIVEANRSMRWFDQEELVNQLRRFCELEILWKDERDGGTRIRAFFTRFFPFGSQ